MEHWTSFPLYLDICGKTIHLQRNLSGVAAHGPGFREALREAQRQLRQKGKA